MATVFVIGLSLELAGAVLLAAELLTLDPNVLAARGKTFPGGKTHFEAQVPASRTFAGIGLFAAGFTVQIGGYVVDDGVLLAVLALAVVAGSALAGRLASDLLIAPWLYRRAVRAESEDSSAS